MTNNKDAVPLAHYQSRFAALEPDEIAHRCGAPFDGETGSFLITMLNHQLKVRWPRFSMAPRHPHECPAIFTSAPAQILIIRYLNEGVHSTPTGRFLSYREFPWGEVYDRNFQGRCVKRLASAFGLHLADFAARAERLGGVRTDSGDCSYELAFLPELKIRLILHAGDDEFPPSAQFLFSDNIALAFSSEDRAVVGDIVIGALKESDGGAPAAP